MAKIAQPHAAYSALQLQQVAQKFAYAGPQVTYGPQQIGRPTAFVPSQPVPVGSYGAASSYAPMQYYQPNYQYQPQQQQQPQFQPQPQQYQIQPQYAQQYLLPSQVGPLSYQNSYAFVPMDAVSLKVHSPSLQNQGLVTHTQALAPTHATAPVHLQLVYPHIATTQAAKTITPIYAGYDQRQHYSQNYHGQPAYGMKMSFILHKNTFVLIKIHILQQLLYNHKFK